MTPATDQPVVIVGAGLAGLRCAQVLTQAGVPVLVLEGSDGMGGRVRTDVTADGFRLDRGFQVLFDAYPALHRAVPDLGKLSLRPFDAGALVATTNGLKPLRNPLRHPRATLQAATSPLLTLGDRVRLAGLAADVLAADWDGVADVRGVPRNTLQELAAHGLSRRAVEGFFQPFWGGILLRRDLATSADVFRFTLRMLLRGRAVLPAGGMQALPDTLAAGLPEGTVRVGQKVDVILRDADGIHGVRTAGETVSADQVVVATDGTAAARLLDAPLPEPTLGCATVYFAGRHRLYRDPLLVLDGTGRATINHAALLTNVAPSYAPPGWHLLAATALSEALNLDDDALVTAARRDLQGWFPRADLGAWRLLGVARVPASQFPQGSGARSHLPGVRTATPGLYLAGEIAEDSSINGALRSGEAAAQAVLVDRRVGR